MARFNILIRIGCADALRGKRKTCTHLSPSSAAFCLHQTSASRALPVLSIAANLTHSRSHDFGIDWGSVHNAKLNGDRRHDAYAEKLHQPVEAIQEYNAGLDDSDQFAITSSILRQLSKVKPRLVKEWMAEYKAELDNYNAGYGSHQNTGKSEPCEII